MAGINGKHNLPHHDQAADVPLAPSEPVVLHHLADVRQREGVMRRTVARHLGIGSADVKQQEQPTTDIPLSVLYRWQKVLNVPITELLLETGEPVTSPVMRRGQLVRLMKTASAILQRTDQKNIQRLAQTLVDQLIDMMPELRDISPWHVVGQRRRRDEYGRAAHRHISADVFYDPND